MTRVKDPYYQHAQVGITKPGTLNLESPKNLKPQALNPKPPPPFRYVAVRMPCAACGAPTAGVAEWILRSLGTAGI